MLIDWFTVGAQFVNFMVLLWLMKRFLYKPILTAIAAREKRIADELGEAARQQADAETIRQDLLAKSHAFDEERSTLLARASGDATTERDRLLAQSRTEAESLRLEQQAAWQRECVSRTEQLTTLVADEVFAIARKALDELADVELEARMADVLVLRLREMPSAIKDRWIAALKLGTRGGMVRSRYDLAAPSRALIQTAINDSCAGNVPLRFDTGSESVCGIEVIVGGERMAWTVVDYLKSLRTTVDRLRASTTMPPSVAPASTLAPVAVAS